MARGVRVARTYEYETSLHKLSKKEFEIVDEIAFRIMKNPSLGEDDFSGEPGGMVYIETRGKSRTIISYCWPLNDMLIFTALWVGRI